MPTIDFLWDEWSDNVLQETDENNVVTTYFQRPEKYGEVLYHKAGSRFSFYHFDGNGSTQKLTNASQSTIKTFIFSGFGELVASSGTGSTPFAYKGAAGYYTNPVTNDIYVRARTYEPTTGRWLSKDPLGFVDGPNLYVAYFVPDGVDPWGLAAMCLGCCCCAIDVRMPNNAVQTNTNPVDGSPGLGCTFVIELETLWEPKVIQQLPDGSKEDDCTLIWNERSTKGLKFPGRVKRRMIDDVKRIFGEDVSIADQQPRKWYDQFELFWFLQMFKPWRDRKTGCDAGKQIIPITDTPGLWGGNGEVVIQFEIILQSGFNCECDRQERRLCFEFYVEVRPNGSKWTLDQIDCTPSKIPAIKH